MNRQAFMIALASVFLFVAAARSQTWVDLTPVSGPMPAVRAWASAVLDTDRGQIVIFGGRNAGGDLNDIWGFDLAGGMWTDLTPVAGSAPASRRTPASVYDPVAQRMVTWSGQASGVFFNDSWTFDLLTNTWTQLVPAGGPPNVRYGAAVVYDPVAGELVTFAGFTNMGRFDDVWRLDAGAQTWTDASPLTGPIERCLHAACYDSREHRMIMYGGQNGGQLADIWALDLTTDTWTDLTPGTSPPGRFHSPNVYDVTNHRATVFGGNTSAGLSNDVWVFELWTDQWTQLTPGGTAPTAREGSAGVYDGSNDRMIVFGGNDGSFSNQVWAIENLSSTVTGAGDIPTPSTALHQNVPNPFNPTTRIEYVASVGERVRLTVYTIRGERIRTLVDGVASGGIARVTWDGRNDAGVRVASGVFLYRLDSGGKTQSRKMLLLK